MQAEDGIFGVCRTMCARENKGVFSFDREINEKEAFFSSLSATASVKRVWPRALRLYSELAAPVCEDGGSRQSAGRFLQPQSGAELVTELLRPAAIVAPT